MAKTPPEYFSKDDEQEIVNAIKAAERDTSGEIRVHIEKHLPEPENAANYVRALFFRLEMQNTEQRNGVLIYIAMVSKTFYILGDEGIDKCVKDNFWDSTRDSMAESFKQTVKDGLVTGIRLIGKQLKDYFPYDSTTDINELPDTISKG